jgi:hypothetical protein
MRNPPRHVAKARKFVASRWWTAIGELIGGAFLLRRDYKSGGSGYNPRERITMLRRPKNVLERKL